MVTVRRRKESLLSDLCAAVRLSILKQPVHGTRHRVGRDAATTPCAGHGGDVVRIHFFCYPIIPSP